MKKQFHKRCCIVGFSLSVVLLLLNVTTEDGPRKPMTARRNGVETVKRPPAYYPGDGTVSVPVKRTLQ